MGVEERKALIAEARQWAGALRATHAPQGADLIERLVDAYERSLPRQIGTGPGYDVRLAHETGALFEAAKDVAYAGRVSEAELPLKPSRRQIAKWLRTRARSMEAARRSPVGGTE